jgi:hypothetical protein
MAIRSGCGGRDGDYSAQPTKVGTGFAKAIKLAQIAYTYLRFARARIEWRMILSANRFPLRRIMR